MTSIRAKPASLRADRRSTIRQHGLSVREAMVQEWRNSRTELARGGLGGAARFAGGKGRGGDFGDI